jgi:hypothetical protein
MTVATFTIGFGDLRPSSTRSRVFLVFWTIIGIQALSLFYTLVLGKVVSEIFNRFRKRYRKFLASRLYHCAECDIPYGHGEHPRLHRLARIHMGLLLLFLAFLVALLALLLGALIFIWLENNPDGTKWTYSNSLYFCYVAASTIGFGDFAPVTFGGRLAFVLWIYPAVLCQTMFFASVVNIVLQLSEVMVTLDPKHNSPLSRALVGPDSGDMEPDEVAAAERERGLESKPVWYYIDDEGREQGPHTNALMQSWLVAGYLHPDLRVRKEEAGSEGDTRHLVQRQRQQGHQHGPLHFSFHWRAKQVGPVVPHQAAAPGAEVAAEEGRRSRGDALYAILGSLLQDGRSPFQPKPPLGLRPRGVARTEVLEMSGVTTRHSQEINQHPQVAASGQPSELG